MRHIYIAFLLLSYATLAQTTEEQSYLTNRYMLERLAGLGPTDAVTPGIRVPARISVVGSVFLNDNFSKATFLLADNRVTASYYAKYSLLRNEFYIFPNDSSKKFHVIAGINVKSFQWKDSLTTKSTDYIAAKDFMDPEGVPYVGFFELLTDGFMPLLRKTELIIQEPNFQYAQGTGRTDIRCLKKEHLYFIAKGQVTPLPSEKRIATIFGALQESMEEFIKLNNMDLSNELHLIALFDYYNEKVQ